MGQQQTEHSAAQLHEWLCAVGFTLKDYSAPPSLKHQRAHQGCRCAAGSASCPRSRFAMPFTHIAHVQLVDPERFPTASAAKKLGELACMTPPSLHLDPFSRSVWCNQ
eukprot:3581436-Rhodomonas_salina.1